MRDDNGDDDDLAIILSSGEVCGSQQHGIPPLPNPELTALGKVSTVKCYMDIYG